MLGKQRGNPLDVGELDRIVIAMMQELEHSTPKGLSLGHRTCLAISIALWRRFDLTLEFKAPSQTALVAFGRQSAKQKGIAGELAYPEARKVEELCGCRSPRDTGGTQAVDRGA